MYRHAHVHTSTVRCQKVRYTVDPLHPGNSKLLSPSSLIYYPSKSMTISWSATVTSRNLAQSQVVFHRYNYISDTDVVLRRREWNGSHDVCLAFAFVIYSYFSFCCYFLFVYSIVAIIRVCRYFRIVLLLRDGELVKSVACLAKY